MSPYIAPLFPIAIVLLVLWGIHRIRYKIDDRYVRVVFGGITLRKIALTDIESVDTQAPLWNEHWCNTLVTGGRVVRIHRRTGWIRDFIITPVNRDEFIRQLTERLGTKR